MPIITNQPRVMGDGTKITMYTDSVGPAYVTYTFNVEQEKFTITNKGLQPIVYTVGSSVDVTVNPGETSTVSTNFTSFQVKSTSGVQQFAIETDEAGDDFGEPGLKRIADKFGDLSDFKALGKSIVEKAQNEFNDRGINVKWFGAKGSMGSFVGSITWNTDKLTIDYPDFFEVGQSVFIYNAGAKLNETVDLVLKEGSITDGTITITLDGVNHDISITGGLTPSQVGDAVLANSAMFTGWTVSKVTVLGNLSTHIRFTATVTGKKTTHSFDAHLTGVSATINVVQSGLAPVVAKITAKNGNILTLDKIASTTAINTTVKFDDTAAIKEAVDSVEEFGTVELPYGNYYYTNLLFTKPVRIVGKGKLIQHDYTNNHGIQIKDTNDVMIDGLYIDGSKQKQQQQNNWHAIYIENCGGVKIMNCHIEHISGNGIMVDKSNKCVIRHNYVGDIAKTGIRVAHIGSDDNIIDGNHVIKTDTQNGIYLTAKNDGTLTTDYIYRNIVVNNVLLDAGDVGIESGQHCVKTIIANNVCHNNFNIGILVRDNLDTLVQGNIVDNNNRIGSSYGIALWRHNSPVSETRTICKNNIVLNTDTHAIFVDENARCTVENNKVYNCKTSAIYLIGSSHVVRFNEIQKVGNGISFDGDLMRNDEIGSTNCLNAHIEGNRIENILDKAAIYIPNKALYGVVIKNNAIKLIDLTMKSIDATGSTAENSYEYGNQVLDTATPEDTRVNTSIFVRNQNGVWGKTVPLTQYGNLTLAKPNDLGTVMLTFGSSFLIMNVYPETGSGDNIGYTVVKSSSDIADKITNITTGWGLTKTAGGNIVLQRRGATITGDISYKRTLISL